MEISDLFDKQPIDGILAPPESTVPERKWVSHRTFDRIVLTQVNTMKST
jgi:hypothetical protein